MAVLNFDFTHYPQATEAEFDDLEIPDNVVPIIEPAFNHTVAADALIANRRKEQQQRFQQIGEGETLGEESIRITRWTQADMLAGLVAVSSQKNMIAFHDKPTFCRPREVMRCHFLHCETDIGTKEKPAVAKTFDLWARDEKRVTVEELTFDPRYGIFCHTHEGHTALNLWRYKPNNPPKNWREQIKPFLDHVEYLIPINDERSQFLDWLAHNEQKPGELPHFHYLMIAECQGVGRNWLSGVFANMWSGNVAINFDLSRSLQNGFNQALSRKRLVVVDEINEGGKSTRWAHAETLKSMVTASHREINVKFGTMHSEVNCARWLLFSNHLTALPLDDDDRRWTVIRNPNEAREPEYYQRLYGLLKDQLFISSVRQFLIERDISKFNPGSRAVKNEIKKALISSGYSMEDENAMELVRTYERDIIPNDYLFQCIYGELPGTGYDDSRKWRLLGVIARKAGITKLPQEISVQGRKSVKIWCLRNVTTWAGVTDRDTLCRELYKAAD